MQRQALERRRLPSILEKSRSFKKRVAEKDIHIAPKYDSGNTTELLFRLNASVWPNVFPWCVANTAIAFAIHYSDAHYVDVSTKDKAHVFMSLMVSFLVVTRSKICLGRYMAARTGLSDLMRTSKELIQHAVAFTRYKNPGENGTKWRVAMANRTISMLRVVVAILRFPSSKQFVCELTDIADDDRDAMKLAVGRSNERSPHVLILFLRSLIASHQHKIKPPLEVPQEMCLHQYTSDFLKAYSNIMSNVATPYPFPLVQMTRTFLFLYVFSLPFVLADDILELVPYLAVVFFMTYGFIGLELISIEMDDPFGDDPNDFNIEAVANSAYKDIVVCIEDIDGREASRKVKDNFDFTIRQRIQKTIEYHKSYTRVPEWGGSAEDSKIDHIAEKIQARERKRLSSDISAMSEILMSIQKADNGTSIRNLDLYDRSPSPTRRGVDDNSLLSSVTLPALNNLSIQSPLAGAFEITGIPEALDENAESSGLSFADDDDYNEDDDEDDLAGVNYDDDDDDNAVYDNDDDIENGISYGSPSSQEDSQLPLSDKDIETGNNAIVITNSNNYGSLAMDSSRDVIQRMDSISSDQRNFMAAVQQYDAVPTVPVAPISPPVSPLPGVFNDSRSRTFSVDTRVTVDSFQQQQDPQEHEHVRDQSHDQDIGNYPVVGSTSSSNVAQSYNREEEHRQQLQVQTSIPQDRSGVESGSLDGDMLSSNNSTNTARSGSLGRFRLPRTSRTPRSPFKKIKSAFKSRRS